MVWEAEDVIRLRERLDLTQIQLGEKVGVTQESISQYESGFSTPSKSVCKHFDLLEKELFGCSK